jgi:hypothetical protein
MKFTTGLVVGVAIGWAIANRLREQADADEEQSGVLSAMARHPSARRFADRSGRVANIAGDRAAEAIRRARANLQRRLETNVDDLSMN